MVPSYCSVSGDLYFFRFSVMKLGPRDKSQLRFIFDIVTERQTFKNNPSFSISFYKVEMANIRSENSSEL